MTFKEIETKYNAKKIKLKDFDTFCKSLNPVSEKQIGSYDYYYVKSETEFLRYRSGTKPELTIKRKTKAQNNYIRVEVNLPINPKTSENKRLKIVEAFCNGLGFFHNFVIYKTCHIYYYKNFNFVFYVVFDENLKEKARFIEIEMDEEYPWPNEATAWSELLKIEEKLKAFGITYKHRISESLYEMFRKT